MSDSSKSVFSIVLTSCLFKSVNTYGSLFAYIVGMFVRLSGGENLIGLPPLIKYPWYDEEEEMQLFPFRTVAMLLSLSSLMLISLLTRYNLLSGHDALVQNMAYFLQLHIQSAEGPPPLRCL